MARNAESIVGTEPGLEPWQFYGPSTRRGRPHLPAPADAAVRHRHGARRAHQACPRRARARERRGARVHDPRHDHRQLLNPDPLGELLIEVPESAIDELATVIAVDFEPGTLGE